MRAQPATHVRSSVLFFTAHIGMYTGPPCPSVFVRAHLHRSQGPHILPSRATGIPSLPVGSSRPLIGQSVRSSCPYRCHFGTNIHLVDHLSIRCIHLLQEGILAATLHYSLDRLQYLPTHRATSSWVTSSQRVYILLRLPVFWAIMFSSIHILTRSDRSIDSKVTSKSFACITRSLSGTLSPRPLAL